MNRFTAPAKRPTISKKDLTVLIPCAGIRHRMKSHGVMAMTPLAFGMNVLEHHLRTVTSIFPQADIIVVAGFQEERIRKNIAKSVYSQVRIVVNEDFANSNITKSIGLGLRACITDNVILIYGDLVYNRFAIENLVGEQISRLVVPPVKYQMDHQVGMTLDGRTIKNLAFGLAPKWAQIGMFTGLELELLRRVCYAPENSKWLGYEAINKIIDWGGNFEVFTPMKMRIAELGSTNDIPLAIEISK